MLIAGTRVALGAGIGLLLSDRLTEDQRKAAGWALLAVGVLTTIPISERFACEAAYCKLIGGLGFAKNNEPSKRSAA